MTNSPLIFVAVCSVAGWLGGGAQTAHRYAVQQTRRDQSHSPEQATRLGNSAFDQPVPPAPCKASATARAKMSSGSVNIEFSVRIAEPREFSSTTGSVSFRLRVKNGDGKEQILANYTERWFAREGVNFSFAATPIVLRPDVATSLGEVIDVKILECSAAAK